MRRTYLWPVIILCAAVLISPSLFDDRGLRGDDGGAAPLSPEPSDSFIFQLELGGQVVAEYSECFGLGSSNEIEESVVQTDAGAVKQKTPGVLEWHNITLRRIGPSSAQVWSSWRKAMEDGRPDQAIRNGAIIMFKSGSSEPLAKWDFTQGWPASLTIQGSAEELTIVHQGLERAGGTERQGEPALR
jgi:phage tail-like protein